MSVLCTEYVNRASRSAKLSMERIKKECLAKKEEKKTERESSSIVNNGITYAMVARAHTHTSDNEGVV